MSYGVLIKESMSGWIEFEEQGRKLPFSFHINAYTQDVLNFEAERQVQGVAHIDGMEENIPVNGVLTLHPTGPSYELALDTQSMGEIEVVGKKTYALKGLIDSLTTCPMKVYANQRVVGSAETKYREPLWKFAVESVRVRKEEDAFYDVGMQ